MEFEEYRVKCKCKGRNLELYFQRSNYTIIDFISKKMYASLELECLEYITFYWLHDWEIIDSDLVYPDSLLTVSDP